MNIKTWLLTEEDLRKIVRENLHLERRIITYSGPRGASRYDSEDVSCQVAGQLNTELSSRRTALKQAIGEDNSVTVDKVYWTDIFNKADVARVDGRTPSDEDKNWYRVTIGFEDASGGKRYLAIQTNVRTGEKNIYDAATTDSGSGSAILHQNNKITDPDGVNETFSWINSGDMLSRVIEWLSDAARNKELCDTSASRRRRSQAGAAGISSITTSTWWDGNSSSGDAVERRQDASHGGDVVLLISITSDAENVISSIHGNSGLASRKISTGGARHAYFIPKRGSVVPTSSTYFTEANSEIGSNKSRLGNYDPAVARFISNNNVARVLKIVAKAMADAGTSGAVVLS